MNLKNCPFCGSKQIEIRESVVIDGCSDLYCDNCGAETHFFGDQNTAIEKWNARHNQNHCSQCDKLEFGYCEDDK